MPAPFQGPGGATGFNNPTTLFPFQQENERLRKENEEFMRLLQTGFQPQTGSPGLSFINSLGFRGVPFTNPQGFLDPTSGGRNEFNTPFIQAAFLQSQFGPEGLLSPTSRSLGVAGDVRDLIGQREEFRRRLMDSLGAGGVSDSVAAAIAERTNFDTSRGLSALLSSAESDLRERSFDAQREFINAITQTAIAEKQQASQEKIAREGASATRSAGRASAIGSLLGSAIGAFA